MWPWILGSAALGGLQAYGQSGGDIGKTLTGAAISGGLGALVPGAGRFAGTALQNSGVLAPLASNLTQTAMKARQLAGLAGPVRAITPQQLAGLAGTGATWAAGAAVPAVAGGLTNAASQVFGGGSRKASDALQGSMQLLGAGRQLTSPEITGDWNPQDVRSVSGYGPDNYLRVADPFGPVAGQVLAGKLNTLGQLEQQKILAPYALGMMDKVTDKEMLRQAAMAQLKTQLAQGAQAMSQAQLGAQSLAQQGMGGMIAAAAQRGGYV